MRFILVGILINEMTGDRVELKPIHIVGRNSSSSDTCLPYPIISSLHAYLRWEGAYWVITDFSRNGTFVDGNRLQKGCGMILKLGHRLQFGSNDGQIWRFTDDSKPTQVLVPVSTQAEPIRFERNLFLSGNDSADLSILQDSEGDWILETLGQVRYLQDGDKVTIAGEEYCFQASKAVELTEIFEPNLAGPPIRLTFHLSTDEEHTKIRISLGDAQLDLGERGHHYLLATLARKRLADAVAGIDPTAQGWLECEALAIMLGIDVQHVNIHIFRARQQIAKLAPSHDELVNIVERRRGGIRLAALPFTIYRGSNIEGHYPPGLTV
jgi:hypothetical protein